MKAETTYAALMGRFLAHKRKELGMDQTAISKKVGMNKSSWSRMENGDMIPDALQLSKIAYVLGMQPDEIIREVEAAKKFLEERQGIKVHMETEKKVKEGSKFGFLALLGAAALGGIVATALSKENSKPPTNKENE